MNRRHLLAKTLVAWAMTATPWLHAAEEAPDAWIKRLSTDVLDTIKNDKSLQSGNLPKVIALVDSKIMPNLGGLDISPIFAFIALNLVDMLVIGNLAAMTGLPQQLSPFL